MNNSINSKDDLISRRAAIDAILDLQDCYNGFSDTYDKACIIGVLEELPPVTEKWVEIGEFTDSKGVRIHVLNCPRCGALHRVQQLYTGEYVNAEFCPHCGIKMEAERRDYEQINLRI